MITVPRAPRLDLRAPWDVVSTRNTHHASELRVQGHSAHVTAYVERCAAGRLRVAYPVGAHDIEVRVEGSCPPDDLSDLLRALADAVAEADPRCRRIVFAADTGDRARVLAAGAADFRYVLDLDLGAEELGLFVTEPEWVTRTDMDLDRVPGA